MRERTAWIAVLAMCLMLAVAVRVTGQAQAQKPPQPAQQPPPTTGHGGPPPPGTPAQPPGPGEPPRFPAHQRPPADPAVVERGRGLYVGACAACHGVDARGGQLGGPNLLRSQLVLNDNDGELILPIVKNGRPGTPMAPMPMAEADVKAVSTYLHHLQAQGSNQGGPPPGEEVPLNILVGNAKAGEKFFAGQMQLVPFADGRPAGHRDADRRAEGAAEHVGRRPHRGRGVPAPGRQHIETRRRHGRGHASPAARRLKAASCASTTSWSRSRSPTAPRDRSAAPATCRRWRSATRWPDTRRCWRCSPTPTCTT